MPNILYARTSTEDQSLDRQLVGDYDKVFTDQVSGSTTSREGLDAMFAYVRAGDTVHVNHTDRLTRSGVTGMDSLLAKFRSLGVHIKFANLPDTIYADQPLTSQNQFMLDMMASLDRMQRGKIREVAAQGIAVAKSKDILAKAEGRTADVKYKGREATYDTAKVRLAILATKAYGSLNKQLVAINSGYVTATDEKLAKAGGALISLTRNVLHRQRQAMQLEGLLK
jgi:DNA invertase Pin-like site-specific DNA recombinase